jgi:lauroyl/myristoyl acyltransferase
MPRSRKAAASRSPGTSARGTIALVSGAETYPITIFVKPPTNRVAAWIVERLRRRSGAELLPPHHAMEAAYAALERKRVVVFVQDQRHNRGNRRPFFGAARAHVTGVRGDGVAHEAPLFGIRQWKENGVHHLRVERLDWSIPEDRDEAVPRSPSGPQQFYESAIRQRPWSWLGYTTGG